MSCTASLRPACVQAAVHRVQTILIGTLVCGITSSAAFAGGDSGESGGAQPDPALRLELGAEDPKSLAEPATAPPAQPDPTLRLPDSGSSDGGDSYQLSAHLDDGSVLLARILITNAGPGDHNAIATGLWIEADGTTHNFDNVRRNDEWQLAADRKRFDIGSTHLDLTGEYARYWITKKRIQLDIQLPLTAGVALPDDFEPPGANAELLATLVPVVGTIRLRGWDAPREIRGTANFVHAWSKSAAIGAARRITASATRDGESLLIFQARTSAGESRAFVVHRSPETGLRTFEDAEAAARGQLPGDRPAGYPTPSELVLSGAAAQGRVQLGEVVFERDALSSFPAPLRSLMGFALKTRPLRVWARASIDVTMRSVSGGTPSRFQGEGTAAIAFSDTFSGR